MRGVGINAVSQIISSEHFSKRNVYFEKSKADDFQFIMDLIKKIEQEIPQADMTNVNIAGTLNTCNLTASIWYNSPQLQERVMVQQWFMN